MSACSTNLSTKIIWDIEEDLHGSDHNPIILHFERNNTTIPFNPTFKPQYANWALYCNTLEHELSKRKQSDNNNKENALLTKSILSAANVSIPQNKPRKSSHNHIGGTKN